MMYIWCIYDVYMTNFGRYYSICCGFYPTLAPLLFPGDLPEKNTSLLRASTEIQLIKNPMVSTNKFPNKWSCWCPNSKTPIIFHVFEKIQAYELIKSHKFMKLPTQSNKSTSQNKVHCALFKLPMGAPRPKQFLAGTPHPERKRHSSLSWPFGGASKFHNCILLSVLLLFLAVVLLFLLFLLLLLLLLLLVLDLVFVLGLVLVILTIHHFSSRRNSLSMVSIVH